MSTHWIAAFILVAALACSKTDNGGSEAETQAAGKTAPKPDDAPADKATATTGNPCELLTEAIVRKSFNIADEIKVDQSLSEPGGHPHCTYNWKTLTPEEEKEINAKRQQEILASINNRGKAGSGGAAQGIVNLAMGKNFGFGSAHLTMTKEMDSEDAAVRGLDAARAYMEKRAKAKVGGEDVDFTSSFVAVEGIGNKAHYSAKQRQISVAYGNRLYHLGATPDKEGDSLEIATAIAKEIFP